MIKKIINQLKPLYQIKIYHKLDEEIEVKQSHKKIPTSFENKVEHKKDGEFSLKETVVKSSVVALGFIVVTFFFYKVYLAEDEVNVSLSSSETKSSYPLKFNVSKNDLRTTINKEAKNTPQIKTDNNYKSNVSKKELLTRDYSSKLQIVASQGSTIQGKRNLPRLNVPKNSYLGVTLSSGIFYGDYKSDIIATSYTNLNVHNNVIIPIDSEFIGQIKSMKNGRVIIAFHSVILPSGKEYSIQGYGYGMDQRLGLKANIDYKFAKNSKNVVLRSLLRAAGDTMSVSTGSFGQNFIGNMADNTNDHLDTALSMQESAGRYSSIINRNTKFKIVFN